MAESRPGFDEIALTDPPPGQLCNDRGHRNASRTADVLVTFGELGTRFRDDLWRESWHRSYPMCADCWERTRQTALKYRPSLTVRDLSHPPVPPAPGGTR
jgi:hypothetical protein